MSREWTSATARKKPTIAPPAKPSIASFAVNHAEWSSTVIRSGPADVCLPSAPKIVCRCGSVVSLTGNGHVQPVSIHVHR